MALPTHRELYSSSVRLLNQANCVSATYLHSHEVAARLVERIMASRYRPLIDQWEIDTRQRVDEYDLDMMCFTARFVLRPRVLRSRYSDVARLRDFLASLVMEDDVIDPSLS
jgi:hypothetical protein